MLVKKDKPQRFIVLIISNNKLLVINFLRNFLSLNQGLVVKPGLYIFEQYDIFAKRIFAP